MKGFVRYYLCIVISAFVILCNSPLQAISDTPFSPGMSDLYPEHLKVKMFGSEKAMRYPIDFWPFFEVEQWEKGPEKFYTFQSLWLGTWFFRSRDYPKIRESRFLLFYNHLRSKTDDRSLNYLFPLYFYNRGKSSTSHLSLLHLYNSEKDGEQITWGMPLLPLLYYSESSPTTSYKRVLTLFDWETKKDTGLERFWAFPVVFYKKQSYLHIAPLYFSLKDNEKKQKIYWGVPGLPYYYRTEPEYRESFILPLYYYKREKESKTHLSPLHLYSSQKNREKTIWGTPLIPLLYYSESSPTESYKRLLTLFDWETKKDTGLERFWAFPVAFYKKQSYLHILPLYFSLKDNEKKQKIYGGIPGLPFYYRTEPEYKKSFIFPLYYYKREKESTSHLSPLHLYSSKENGKEKSWGTPLIPLLYYSESTPTTSYKRVLTLFDWETKKDTGLERFWAFPVAFYKKQSYLHVLPLYFSLKDSEKKQKIYWGVPGLPFYHRTEPEYKKSFIFPLYYYKREKESTSHLSLLHLYNSKNDGEEVSWGTPLIPLLYYSENSPTKSYKRVLTLFDWETKKDTGLERFWAFPITFYKKQGYFYFLPLYFRPQAYTAESGVTVIPLLYYHRWSPETDKLWAGLIYYHNKNDLEKSSSRVVLPLYYNWENSEERGDIFAPFYFNYEDKHRSIHVNLAGLSSTRRTGNLDIDVGKIGTEKWYLDTEVSFFYNIFSFSWRISASPQEIKKFISGSNFSKSVREPSSEPSLETFNKIDTAKIQTAQKESIKNIAPHLFRGKTSSRKSAEYFHGIELLFGLFAYEQSDTRRHIHIPPFLWFTWDVRDQVNDHVNVTPIYLSYSSPETGFFVLFPVLPFLPLYGKQREGDSYFELYFLNLFWREYDADLKKKEWNFLWPLVKYHTSPTDKGYRILPVAWHREYTNKDIYRNKTWIFPLLYYSNHEKQLTKGIETKTVVNPLYYTAEKRENGILEKKKIGPLFAPLYWSGSRQKETIIGKKDQRMEESKWQLLFPLFLTKTDSVTESQNGSAKEKTNSKEFKLFALPLIYYYSRTFPNTDEKETTLLALLYYHHIIGGQENYYNFLHLISYSKGIQNNERRLRLLFGLVSVESKKDFNRSWFFPLYHYKKEIKREGAEQLSTTSLLLFPGFYYYGSSDYSRKNFLFLADHISSKRDGFKSYSFLFRTIHYEKSEKENYSKFQLLYSLLFGYKGYKNQEYYNLNFLWLFREKRENRSSFSFLPFLTYSRTVEGKNTGNENISKTFFVPLLFSYSQTNSDPKRGDVSFFPPGLYLSKSARHSRTNFMFLYDHLTNNETQTDNYRYLFHLIGYEKSPVQKSFYLFPLFYHKNNLAEKEKAYGFLLNTFYYNTKPQTNQFKFLWGFGADYTGYNKLDDYDFKSLFYLYGQNRTGSHFSSYLLPVWYYASSPNSRSFLFVPTLSYFSHDQGNIYQNVGAWTLWYNKYNAKTQDERKLLLMGLLYHSQTKAERGYSSRSMGWGILWKYERETETDFTKLKILLLPVYKKIRDDAGQIRRYFFGIRAG